MLLLYYLRGSWMFLFYILSAQKVQTWCISILWKSTQVGPVNWHDSPQITEGRCFFPTHPIHPGSIYVLTLWEYLGSFAHVFLSEKMQLTNPVEVSVFVSLFYWIRVWNLLIEWQGKHQSWLRGAAFWRQQAIRLVQFVLSYCTLHQTKHHMVKHNSALWKS